MQLQSTAEPVESTAQAPASGPAPEWARFSASRLWQWQREYFEERGVTAWSSGQVPHYITSNPYAAASFAGIVIGWLRDWAREAADASQPFYILELGAGPGRFAFHFLRRFLRMLKGSALRDLPVKYVMTDFCEATIAFWRSHEMLRRFADAGVLDFARFDAGSSREVRLLESDEMLQPGLGRPLAVIANYCFDSIPADAFAIVDGKLMECLISVPAEAGPPDGSNPNFFAQLRIQAERRELTGEPYANPT
jgi:hypothetical protein